MHRIMAKDDSLIAVAPLWAAASNRRQPIEPELALAFFLSDLADMELRRGRRKEAKFLRQKAVEAVDAIERKFQDAKLPNIAILGQLQELRLRLT